MNDKNIFLIGTKHQYHQVEMAISHFNLDKKDIYLLVEDLGLDKIFHNDLKNKSFGEVIIFKSWIFKDLIYNPERSNNFITICKEIALRFKSFNLYTSHYDSDSNLLASSILKPKKIFLLDEGNASFGTALDRRNNRDKKFTLLIKSFLYKIPIFLPSKITYFTKYNLKTNLPDNIELYKEKMIDNSFVALDKDVVIFLGSSVVEVGMIKKNIYCDLLKRISSDYKNKKIHYYPHRKENLNKLKELEDLGFNIIKNELPFEILFLSFNNMPYIMASIYITGVLDNISKRYKNIPELIMYKFDDVFLLKQRDTYRDIYNHLKKNKSLTIKEI
jgi:hypothetical protein